MSKIIKINVDECPNKELALTAEQMVSAEYKERFKAEYIQLKNRFNGLKAMCEKWDKGELSFTPTCPRSLYDEQLQAMNAYIQALTARAVMEQVEL